jgi:hypothetical protein
VPRVHFSIRYHGCVLTVHADDDGATYPCGFEHDPVRYVPVLESKRELGSNL